MQHDLPPLFRERMRDLLGGEGDAFLEQYEQAPRAGLRVNLLKLSVEQFLPLAPWALEPVPWCRSGFYVPPDARPGKHPFHPAGLYYLQEPSAMAVVEALDIRPGQKVLDLASAPGGKTTHIASLLGGQGILVANEVEGGRIKALGENLERWGTPNVVVTNDTAERLATLLGPTFDRVLVDAPCSGEGMFRKNAGARAEWSPAHVVGCATRQARILEQAARLVHQHGLLLYSTCTFAPEENEQRIAAFLDTHPDWELVDIPKQHGFVAARPDWVPGRPRPELTRAVRLWPHHLAGEGHFMALLMNHEETSRADQAGTELRRAATHGRARERGRSRQPEAESGSRDAVSAWRAFQHSSLRISLPAERLLSRREQLYLLPAEAPSMDGLNIVRPGLWLGTAKPGRFEPSHALALALDVDEAQLTVALSEQEAARYLKGETIERAGPDGWALVTLHGRHLGWGRRVGTVVKNFYPKGLRWTG